MLTKNKIVNKDKLKKKVENKTQFIEEFLWGLRSYELADKEL